MNVEAASIHEEIGEDHIQCFGFGSVFLTRINPVNAKDRFMGSLISTP